MKVSERKQNVLNFLEKEISEKNDRAEKILILMEGIKTGLDLEKKDKI